MALTVMMNTIPVSAASNSRSVNLANSFGTIKTTVSVGSYVYRGPLMMDYYFDSSVASQISTTKSVKDHVLALTLQKDGLQGNLSAGVSSSGPSASASVSQVNANVAKYTTGKSTAKSISIDTTNNYIHRSVFDVAGAFIVTPLAGVLSYFTITGTANTQAVIGGKTFANSCATTQYW